MDTDVRAFCYALTYNSVILVLALTTWIYIIRPIRKDRFRPNHRKVLVNQSSTSTSVEDAQASGCFSLCPGWASQLWQWEIAKFASTDVYLYLLFLRYTAVLFFIVSCLSMGVVFPVIWLARAESEAPNGGVRERSFFERGVITNVISTEYSRLWAIYCIVWLVAAGAALSAWRFYAHVRSDEFRAALMSSKRVASAARKRQGGPQLSRFLPSKHSVAITGLDYHMLDATVLRTALLSFFDEREIVAVHIVMDHSEALTAHRAFQEYLSNLLNAHKHSTEVSHSSDTDAWAIRLPVNSPMTTYSSEFTRRAAMINTLDTRAKSMPTPMMTLVRNAGLIRAGPGQDLDTPLLSAAHMASAHLTSRSHLPESYLTEAHLRVPCSGSAHPRAPSHLETAHFQSVHHLGGSSTRDAPASVPRMSSSYYSTSHLGSSLLEGWPGSSLYQLAQSQWSAIRGSLDSRELSYSSDDSSMTSPTEKGDFERSFDSMNNMTTTTQTASSPPAALADCARVLGTVCEGLEHSSGPLLSFSPPEVSPRQGSHHGGYTAPEFSTTMSAWESNESVGQMTFLRCGRGRRDSRENINHWEAKVLSQYSILSRVKSRAPVRNVGIAFVSFRHPEAVRFALTQDFSDPACPRFRSRQGARDCLICEKQHLSGSADPNSLWHARWKIREAPPPEDIIWENIHVSSLGRGLRRLLANLTILLFSLILTSSALAADALNPFAQHIENILGKVSFLRMSVSGWIAPLFLYVINALLLPFLVAWAANASRFWRNSARDRAVLHGNINFMVINSLVFPVIGTTSIQGIFLFLYQNKITNLFTVLGQLVAGASGSFMTRYVLNAAFINSAFQLLQLPMLSQQRVLIKLGKKPTRWTFDFGYWFAFHLSLLAVALLFAVDIPLVPLMGCLFFTAKYWVDKYNFAFGVWKVTAESAGAVASTVVLFIFGFVALFLLIMASYFVAIGLHAASVTKTLSVHLIEEASSSADLFFPIPDQAEPRALVIGGLVLLIASILMGLATFGERAQRSILDHHSSKLRRIARALRTSVARKMAFWGVMVPERPVFEAGPESPELNPSELNELRKAYTHPYERDDIAPID